MYWTLDPDTLGAVCSMPGVYNWSTVRLAAAIVCANLLTYGPLFGPLAEFFASLKTWYTNLLPHASTRTGGETSLEPDGANYAGYPGPQGRYDQLPDHKILRKPSSKSFVDLSTSGKSETDDTYLLNIINVTREH